MEENDFIEQEVQRRLARQTRRQHEELVEAHGVIKSLQNDLIQQHAAIQRLQSQPLYFARLLQSHTTPNPACFKVNDDIVVIDNESPHFSATGRIISTDPVVDDQGKVRVLLNDEGQTEADFSIGSVTPAQIRLAKKDDGTYAVISVDGKPWEVRGVPDLSLQVGDSVKILSDSKQIVSRGYELRSGPICRVAAVTEYGIEIEEKGEKKLVYNPNRIVVEEGDRIVVDPSYFVVIEKLPKDSRQRYKLSGESLITWDDIGGLVEAKDQLREAIELPHLHPELFKFYGMEKVRGVLLWGPPGCGKTLLAKAAANSVARIYGKQAIESGYIYVKSPEILDKWVGNTEAEIRELFDRARRHYKEYDYPAILAFDEFDAIAPQRGTRRSSDVADTIVPMFLGEMDGIDDEQTKYNPIIIVMTNRADILDPAITRPGRISKHIKIDRPTSDTALDILKIHSAKMPFAKEDARLQTLAVVIQDLFSKTRLLYRVNNEFDFTLGDAVSGALLQAVAEGAKANALRRDLGSKMRTGVMLEDFRDAVTTTFRQQRGINHSYDLQDFAERHGIQAQDMKIDRCFGAA